MIRGTWRISEQCSSLWIIIHCLHEGYIKSGIMTYKRNTSDLTKLVDLFYSSRNDRYHKDTLSLKWTKLSQKQMISADKIWQDKAPPTTPPQHVNYFVQCCSRRAKEVITQTLDNNSNRWTLSSNCLVTSYLILICIRFI